VPGIAGNGVVAYGLSLVVSLRARIEEFAAEGPTSRVSARGAGS
jgi:hypothetical protein